MNVAELRKTQAEILAEPRRLRMSTWIETVPIAYDERPPCGTVCCIAGMTVLRHNAGGTIRGVRVVRLAKEILGLSDDQAENLFYVGNWPLDIWCDYDAAKTPQERAMAASKRIDKFIEEYGDKEETP